MDGNLFAKFRAAGPGNDRSFIKTAGGRTITYGDLFDLSGRYANVLCACGVAFGDRVAVQVEKSPEAIILYLACLRLGAIYLPLNPAYTLAELDYFIGDSEPRVMVCAPEREGEVGALAEGRGVGTTLTLGVDGEAGTLPERARMVMGDFADVDCVENDLAAILYTSGTTGRSKGAMLSHGNLASNAETLKQVWRFTRQDVLLHALPIFHTHGLFVACNVTLMAGGSMIFLAKLDADQIFRFLPEATTMMGVPTFYVRLLQDARLTREATAHIRLFISGSAPLLAETHAEWRARTGHAVLERYGMTETNMNTSNPYEGDRVAGSVGPPLPGVDLRITDPGTGKALPQGEIGMIEVRGRNVFKGYWRMPERTAAECRADGFFITGDLGVIDAAGYVSIVGRGKDLVISGGFNVYPKEIESEIDALAGVDESAVIGVPHPDFGECVTAVVTLKSGASMTEAEVLRQLSDRLAKYKQPKRVIFVDALPRNTMGKVQKNILRDMHQGLYQPGR
ncbi:MAG: malonyl-CoA synthase [Rhodospirillales bacterium]|nr:malonyl-CoA synthase [Rhodospirillales bacterium]